MNKGILKLALSGKVPLQFEYRDHSGASSAERPDSAVNEQLDNAAKVQIADAFTWLLHVI
ncbi:MAG: hypothetical protein DMG88_04160 [Acidobacteria bacterium]|nr:MAG: hypothetical protein DMG88_04160 [Acidobacteriota bacterium]